MGLNKIVDFSTAKLLKEKGFDNESAHYYNENGEMLFDTDYPSLQPTKPHVYYDNPTIADVVMWLYETHDIWIQVNNWKEQPVDNEVWNNAFQWFIEGEADGKPFKAPTEAYEAAIEYTLINLIK